MPIASKKPTKTPFISNTPKTKSKTAENIVIDSKYVPATSLLTYAEGALWTVHYYSQILDKHNDVRTQDPTDSAVYQQYQEIKALDLKVTSALSQSYDEATSTMAVTGSALLQSYLIPNFGDMFCADVADGREGVFSIVSVQKKTILKDSIYEIEYRLLFYSDTEPARRQDLRDKTIRTFHYVKEFLIYNQSPLIIESDFAAYNELLSMKRELITNYVSWFYTSALNSLVVPSQDKYVYDPFIVNFFLSQVSTTDAQEVRNIKKLNLEQDKYLKQPTVFTALLKRDSNLLHLCNKQMSLSPVSAMFTDPMFDTIRYTGYTHVVYPLDAMTFTNNFADSPPVFADGALEDSEFEKMISLPDETLQGETIVSYLPQIDFTDYYVYSENFYSQQTPLSLLESLSMSYLKRQNISYVTLLELCKNYYSWTTLQRFYYIPILILLIRATNKTFY